MRWRLFQGLIRLGSSVGPVPVVDCCVVRLIARALGLVFLTIVGLFTADLLVPASAPVVPGVGEAPLWTGLVAAPEEPAPCAWAVPPIINATAIAAVNGMDFNEDELNIQNSFQRTANGVTQVGLQPMPTVKTVSTGKLLAAAPSGQTAIRAWRCRCRQSL